jgi:hypothetical protein
MSRSWLRPQAGATAPMLSAAQIPREGRAGQGGDGSIRPAGVRARISRISMSLARGPRGHTVCAAGDSSAKGCALSRPPGPAGS